MSGVILLLWISIVVILHVRGEDLNDNSNYCEHCSSDSLSECLETGTHSVKIHCQRPDLSPCILAIVMEEGGSDSVCLLKEHEEPMNELSEAKSSEKLEEILTTEISPTEEEKTMPFEENHQAEVTQKNLSDVTNEEIPSAAIVTENNNELPPTAESTLPHINVITVNPMETTDPTMIVVINTDNENTNTQSVSNLDPIDYPQADQPMSEPENDNTLKPEEVEENSGPIQSEVNETPNEIEPETNSIDISGTEMTTGVSFNCFGCVSTEDSNCIAKPSKEVTCKTEGDTPVGCFTLLKGNQLRRGCLEDLDEKQEILCQNSEDKSCHICFNQLCNDKSWPQCYVCHSNSSNHLCTLWTPQTSLTNLIKECQAFDDMCQLEVTATGATMRSCVARSEACNIYGGKSCEACNTTLCNGGVFPKGRLKCHQCADSSKCALEQSTSEALPCPTYNDDDSCFLFADTEGKMNRGCTSSLEDFKGCLLYDSKRCLTCKMPVGCNSQPSMLQPKFSCSKCDTRLANKSTTSIGCAWSQSMASVTPCINKIMYYLDETCEMIYQPDIELAIRGCSHDIGACETTYPGCVECNSSACNFGNLIWQHCLQCSGEGINSCSTNPFDIASETCKSNFQPYEKRGCYTRFNLKTNTTTRGCISDLTGEELDFCKANKTACILCYDQGCNNLLAPSSGNQVLFGTAFHLLLLGLLYSCL